MYVIKVGFTKYSSVAVSLHVRIYGSDLSVGRGQYKQAEFLWPFVFMKKKIGHAPCKPGHLRLHENI